VNPGLHIQCGLDVRTLNQREFVLHIEADISVYRFANPIGAIHLQGVANRVYAVYHVGI
jgi:hypothetical protein